MRVLVLDHGLSRSALAAVRALDAAGWQAAIGSPSPSLAAVSRSTRAHHHVPPPEAGLDAFVDALNAAVAAGGYEAVLGSDDQHMLALSLRRDDIGAAVGYADHERLLAAIDKLELVRAAARAGLSAPHTEDAAADALNRLELPVVVKARVHSGFEGEHARAHLDGILASSAEEATAHAEWMRSQGGHPIFQQAIAGRLMAYTVVADRDSRVVASVQQESERIWPPGAGISTRARTVTEDPELAERCARLIAELGWVGLAELQFMLPAGGEPSLIDLNGRFYGSLALAVAAGANLPAAWASVATGRTPPLRSPARAGVRYQWLEGDLRRALREGEHGAARDVASTLAYAATATHSVFSARDPRPALRYLRVLGRRVLARPLRGPHK